MTIDVRLPGGHTEDNRPPRYEETDSEGNHRVVYRASGWGACDISLGAMAVGQEGAGTPTSMQEKYDEGHKWEPIIIEMIDGGQVEGVDGGTYLVKDLVTKGTDGEQIVCEYGIGDIEVDGEWIDIVCRTALDAVGKITSLGNMNPAFSDRSATVEVKALGKTYWDQFVSGKLKLYDWQISTQIHGGFRDVLLVAGQKKQLPSGKQVIGDVKARLYHVAPISKLEMAERMRAREAVVELARRGEWDGTCAGPHVYPCPHYYLHAAGTDVIEESRDADLTRMVGYRQQLKAELKTVQGLIDNTNEQIESWLQSHGRRKPDAGKLVVRAEQLGVEKTYTVEWFEGDREGYKVGPGKVKYVLVQEASKKDLASMVPITDTPTPEEVEEVFVAIENDHSPRGVPAVMKPPSVIEPRPKGSGRMML